MTYRLLSFQFWHWIQSAISRVRDSYWFKLTPIRLAKPAFFFFSFRDHPNRFVNDESFKTDDDGVCVSSAFSLFAFALPRRVFPKTYKSIWIGDGGLSRSELVFFFLLIYSDADVARVVWWIPFSHRHYKDEAFSKYETHKTNALPDALIIFYQRIIEKRLHENFGYRVSIDEM